MSGASVGGVRGSGRCWRRAGASLALALATAGCDAVSVVGYVDGPIDATSTARDPAHSCPAGSALLGCGADGNACTGALVAPLARPGALTFAVDDTGIYYLPEVATLDQLVVLPPGADDHTVIVDQVKQPIGLVVDETYVYWLTTDGELGRAPRDGSGAGEVLDASNITNGHELALADGRLYTSSAPHDQPEDTGYVTMVEPGAGVDEGLVQPRPRGLAVGAGGLFWSNDGLSAGAGAAAGEIVAAPLELGGAQVVVSGIEPPLAIALGDARVTWIDATGRLLVAPAAGGEPEVLLTDIEEPKDVAVFEGNVYVAHKAATFRVPISGGAKQQVWGQGTTKLEVRCDGVYGQNWYEPGIFRWSRP